jgi:hypothetical protein
MTQVFVNGLEFLSFFFCDTANRYFLRTSYLANRTFIKPCAY